MGEGMSLTRACIYCGTIRQCEAGVCELCCPEALLDDANARTPALPELRVGDPGEEGYWLCIGRVGGGTEFYDGTTGERILLVLASGCELDQRGLSGLGSYRDPDLDREGEWEVTLEGVTLARGPLKYERADNGRKGDG
jgi:hypothetical protein